MHYAEVVEIRISKCPTLTSFFSVVFHPGCPKFCVELNGLAMNIEEEKNWRGKRGKTCKKHEGGVCDGQDWSQNKLGSLEATLVRKYDPPSLSLTGVK